MDIEAQCLGKLRQELHLSAFFKASVWYGVCAWVCVCACTRVRVHVCMRTRDCAHECVMCMSGVTMGS